MPIKKEVQIGDCRLILGDCLEVMPLLDNVDAVVTDPSYEKEAHRKTRKITGRNRGVIAEAFSFSSIEGRRDAVAQLACELSNGWALFFCMAEGVGAWRDSIESAGSKYKRCMIWVKPDAMPQFNGQGPAAGFEAIAAAWCGTGHSKWNGGGRVGTFKHNKNTPGGKHLHETQKPVPLMIELIMLFSNAAQTILDPFMGSGTTLVACAKLGRKGIGIELDPDYFEIACKRVQEAYNQPDLFVEPPKPAPTQEGFDL